MDMQEKINTQVIDFNNNIKKSGLLAATKEVYEMSQELSCAIEFMVNTEYDLIYVNDYCMIFFNGIETDIIENNKIAETFKGIFDENKKYNNPEDWMIGEMESLEFNFLAKLVNGLLFRRVIDDRDYSFITNATIRKEYRAKMKYFYVTMGQIHVHSIDGNMIDKNCVVRFKCNSCNEGRNKAMELFGRKFCFTYFDTDWNEEDMKYYPRGYIDL